MLLNFDISNPVFFLINSFYHLALFFQTRETPCISWSNQSIFVLGTFEIAENIIQKQCTYNVSFGLLVSPYQLVSPFLIVGFFQR